MGPLRRLNVASGNHRSNGWGWDVDLYFPADVQADAGALPFPDEVFEAAYLGHWLEHLPWQSIPSVLGEVRRTLAHGAEVAVVGPCVHLAIQTAQPTWLIEAILSDPRTVDVNPGVHHAWTPTAELTAEAVLLGGFTDVQVVDVSLVDKPAWPNPTTAAWQCAVLARNP